jgi:hypothetical protein
MRQICPRMNVRSSQEVLRIATQGIIKLFLAIGWSKKPRARLKKVLMVYDKNPLPKNDHNKLKRSFVNASLGGK